MTLEGACYFIHDEPCSEFAKRSSISLVERVLDTLGEVLWHKYWNKPFPLQEGRNISLLLL